MVRPFFRQYDLRGPAADLTDELVGRIGRGLAALLAPRSGGPRLVVGRDVRLSSPRLHAALVEGLLTGGADVIDVGEGPSPLVYFATYYTAADGGIVVTGSHNPPGDNGFKILHGTRPLFGPELAELDARLDTPLPPAPARGALIATDATDAYIERVAGSIGLGPHLPRVVVDAGSGAAGALGVRALRAVGVDPVCLHCEPDGHFPHRSPDPAPDQLGALQAKVVELGADVGLAWDGDGDRLGVIDRDGTYVWGDRLLALFARHVLRDYPGGVVLGEVKCSQALFDDVERHGGRGVMCRTGHSHLKARMKEEGAVLGGEISGHFFFGDRYLGFDDAIYAGLRLVEILSREPRSIRELLADLPTGEVTPELRAPCPEAAKERVVALVRDELASGGRLIDVDGVRIAYDDGSWALVRASNTGPSLVLRFEAPTVERLAALRARVEGVVARATARVVGGAP